MPDKPPAKQRFTEAYQSKPPWEIDQPRQLLVDVADRIVGRVLDAGCGTGDNAIYFAERGHEVVGVDFVEIAIERARQKAEGKGFNVTFLLHDALRLSEIDGTFDSVIDSGLFHVFSDDDRRTYVGELAKVMNPGARLFLLCFSDREPGTAGPRRISQDEIHEAFADGWKVESITAARFEDRPDLEESEFTPGGPHAWFCVIRRS